MLLAPWKTFHSMYNRKISRQMYMSLFLGDACRSLVVSACAYYKFLNIFEFALPPWLFASPGWRYLSDIAPFALARLIP